MRHRICRFVKNSNAHKEYFGTINSNSLWSTTHQATFLVTSNVQNTHWTIIYPLKATKKILCISWKELARIQNINVGFATIIFLEETKKYVSTSLVPKKGEVV